VRSPEALFESILQTLCARPELEAEWLDVLSQLEFAGCRKIVKSVPFEKVDVGVLNHAMEEASHAYLLKAQAERMGIQGRSWTKSPLSEMAWTYFQTVDHGVSRIQGEGFHYPAVSWVVEQRVLDVYPRYLQHTRALGVKRVLTRILAQEKRHSTQFGDADFPPAFKSAALEWEASLWSDFLIAVDAWLSKAAPAQAGLTGAIGA
jgi:hypothetical protein